MEVYIDVTNTYQARLNTGIQRVTRELVLRLLDYNESRSRHFFVPVVFLDHLRLWKKVARKEWVRLYRASPEKTNFSLSGLFSTYFKGPFIRDIPDGSIFLDMDSSWHNRLKRASLFKKLNESNTSIIRLHYDLVPILFPHFCHEQTVERYMEHLAASLTYASLFICISRKTEEDLKTLMEKLGFSERFEATLLRLGVNLGMRTEKTAQTKQVGQQGLIFNPLKENEKYVLCVGTLEPRKNHALLLDVFERIHHQYPWVKLVFIGKKGWNVDELTVRITEHALFQKSLFWFSHVKDEMLNIFYKNCALSILPSFYEGYGLPVIESLMNGKIVLCADKGSLPEVGESYADYFDPNNAKTLEALLNKYLSSSKERREREAVVKNFTPHTWHESAQDLIKILEDFISKKNSENVKG